MTVRRSGLAVALTAAFACAGCGGGHKVVVPRAANPAYGGDAIAALCKIGLKPVIVSAPKITNADPNVNGYSVKSVSPAVGASVKTGSTVRLQLSQSDNGGDSFPIGRHRLTLPSVTGLDVNRAIGALTRIGMKVDVKTHVPTSTLTVASQIPPAGTSVESGSYVALFVGKAGGGSCPPSTTRTETAAPRSTTETARQTPDLIGKQLPDARRTVTQDRLAIGKVTRTKSPMPAGTVISQQPPPGILVGLYSEISLTVSKDPG